MIRMVVMDLDETLLRSDKSISAYTEKVLKDVQAEGIKIVYATARGSSAQNFLKKCAFNGRILMNGARALVGDSLLYERTISPAIMQPLLQAINDMGIKVAAEIQGTHYANFDVHHKWSFITKYAVTDFHTLNGNADKLYACIEEPQQTEHIQSLLPDLLYLHVSRDHLAMIMHREATKMQAITAVAKHYSIDISDVVAFGDDMNDADMLKGCGIGVAMGNAVESLRAICTHTCDTNNRDGLAKWLSAHVLS